MGTEVRSTGPARRQAERALTRAQQEQPVGEHALLALQRSAGNAAVNALLAGRLRNPGAEARDRLDGALREIRRDEPALDVVEKGLFEAKAVGVPVDLEGVKPPPAALAVTMTGFGPGSVAPKKAVPPTKRVPLVNPLGKAAKRTPAVRSTAAKRAPGGPAGKGATGQAGGMAGPPRALGPDQLRQPPVAPPGVRPEQDAAFASVRTGLVGAGTQARAHPPAAAKAKEAQDAAVAPTGDLGAQARAAKVDTMDAQQAGSFDKKAFITAVKAAIEAKSPKTLKEADDYKESGKAGEVKGEVHGLVTQGKDGQAKDIETATAAPPDESKAVPKPVTPMAPEPAAAVPVVPGGGAAPKPAPAEQTNLQAGKIEADREMADAGVTEPQLQQSGEPEFQQAVVDKKTAAEHADTAPGEFRKQEQQVIQQNQVEAAAGATAAVAGMKGAKGAAIAGLVAGKAKAKSADETKRAEVTTKIQGIYAAAEKDVKAVLDGIDPKVEAEFGKGEAAARGEFERYVAAKMSAYKKDRYGGWLGGLRWAKDKLVGMPEKVNEFYAAGRELYLQRMDTVISRVADIVGGDLTRAKQRIAGGRKEIAAYVQSLPRDLQKVGGQAAQDIGEKFEALEGEVAAKQEAAVDLLASKYVEARKGLDERIEALQAENRGLIDKAIGALKAIINTIRQLAAMLRDVLARAAAVVGDIVKNPVGFLGNLIAGIKGGILKFKDTILDHLRKGLMGWLFGALAESGVELPQSFDIKGIIGFLASLFGLTWARIRARIAKKVGEPVMGAIETGVEIFQKFKAEGVAGLWQMLLDKLGDIKEMILEQVKDFVITKIITAGITWLIGLLNPAAAFIKACKLIYDVVMFFVENAARIKKFVDTVLDSVADVVRGNVGGVVEKINNVLGQMVPILIGFLASVIGLGGIGKKIREIVEKLQKPVTKAIDWVIDKGLKLAGPVIRGLKKLGGKIKAKVRGGDESPAAKQKRLDSALGSAVSLANRFAGRRIAGQVLRPLMTPVRVRYGLATLEPVKQGASWAIHGVVSRMSNPAPTEAKASSTSQGGGVGTSQVDPAKVKVARRAANAAQSEAAAAYGELRATLPQAPRSARDAIRNATFACSPGSTPRMQGGGTIKQAKADIDDAFRHHFAESQISQVRAEAQKESWLHDRTVTPTDVGEMFSSPQSMRQMRERMRPHNVYVPEGSVRDRGVYARGMIAEQKRDKSTGKLAPTGKMKAGMVRVGTEWGSADAVHAEKLEHGRGSSVIGVSRPMCDSCQRYFSSVAKSLGPDQFIIIHDGARARIFLPGGTVGSPFDF